MDLDWHDRVRLRQGEALRCLDRARDRALHGTSPPHSLSPRPLTHSPPFTQLDKVRQGKFYILCPDNETRREVDQLRIMWGAGDVAEGRPALSRWHRDYKSLFEEYVRDGLESLD